MVEIMWHRRETRWQTEKTNINLNIGRNRSTRLKYQKNMWYKFHRRQVRACRIE